MDLETTTPTGTSTPSTSEYSEDEGIDMRGQDEKGSARVGEGYRLKRRLSRAHSAASSRQPSTSPPISPGLHPRSAAAPIHIPPSPFTRSAMGHVNEKLSSYAQSQHPDDGPPKLFGIELKWLSLITLALQNAFLTIIMHYSRISTPPSRTYSAAAAVFLNEMLKCSISSFIALKKIDKGMRERGFKSGGLRLDGEQRGNTLFSRSRLHALRQAVFSSDCYKLAIPAILYVVQNNLQYVAASNLDVATFQVTYQMKILTTAFFSVIMLGRRLTKGKWSALVLLAIGVGIVQLQATGHSSREGTFAERVMHPMRGFFAVTFACITSGLAGVYFELLLKSDPNTGTGAPDLWIRNTQLSVFSLIPALVPILLPSPNMSWGAGIVAKFSNFNGWAIGTVLTQTFGGLVTAIVIRYSDNIMKGFATSLSIVLSFLASVALFDYHLTLAFMIGASIVLAATFLYNSPFTPEPLARTSVAVTPGSPIPSSAPILGEPDQPSRAASFVNLITGSRRTSTSEAPSYTASLSRSPSTGSTYAPGVNYNPPATRASGATSNPYTS